MKRSLDPIAFNRIANHPEVRPWVGGIGELDLAPMVHNLQNVCFLTDTEDGGYILEKLQAGLYAAHSMAVPQARGRPMLEMMRDGFATMFMATDAIEIVTTVPDGNVRASKWADLAGFREAFRREGCFDLMGEQVGASFRSLSYQDWIVRDKRHGQIGRMFHKRLDEHLPHNHPEDPVHDAWVGATLGGCIEGNIVKAITLYGRWALQAGYRPASVLSVNPPVCDIGNAIVTLDHGRIEVLKATG